MSKAIPIQNDSGSELPRNVSTDQIKSESNPGCQPSEKKIQYYTTKAGIPESMAMS